MGQQLPLRGTLANFINTRTPSRDPLLQRRTDLTGDAFRNQLIIGGSVGGVHWNYCPVFLDLFIWLRLPWMLPIRCGSGLIRVRSPLSHPCSKPDDKHRHLMFLGRLTGKYAGPIHKVFQPGADCFSLSGPLPNSFLLFRPRGKLRTLGLHDLDIPH